MIKFLKQFWFEVILAFVILVFLVFMAIIIAAPHNDAKMRGFAPCTYEMAFRINYGNTNNPHLAEKGQTHPKVVDVLSIITIGYVCYLKVIKDGFYQYLENQQPTPWANYFFTPEILSENDADVEPFSEDLLRANMLDDEETMSSWQSISKGEDNGQKDEKK